MIYTRLNDDTDITLYSNTKSTWAAYSKFKGNLRKINVYVYILTAVIELKRKLFLHLINVEKQHGPFCYILTDKFYHNDIGDAHEFNNRTSNTLSEIHKCAIWYKSLHNT